MKHRLPRDPSLIVLCGLLAALAAPAARAQSTSVYYICPGNVFTNTISPREAEQKGCKSREASQPTTIAGPVRSRPSAAGGAASGPQDRAADLKVDPAEQRARDSDARRILTAELRREEEQLEALKREFNNGQPERRGDERNAQKYQDRIAEMKAALQRKEADVAAIRRELNKLPS